MAAFTLLAQAPAFGSDSTECGTLVKNIDVAATSIASNSVAYWAERKTYIALQSPANSSVAASQVEQSKARALPIKTAMPDALLNFATLIAKARSSDCISEEKASALKETTFTLARRVNIDKFPVNPTIEGSPKTQSRPQMPVK